MDPILTSALISGGSRLLSGLFGGDDPAERQERMSRERLAFDKDRFQKEFDLQRNVLDDQRQRRASVSPVAQAASQAQRLLRNKLLSQAGGIQPRRFDASSIFAGTGNPFARQGSGVRPQSPERGPVSFSPEELGIPVNELLGKGNLAPATPTGAPAGGGGAQARQQAQPFQGFGALGDRMRRKILDKQGLAPAGRRAVR